MTDYEWQVRVKFSADQPRVPAGSPQGGQWTSSGGGDGPKRFRNQSPDDFEVGQRVSYYVWSGGERQELVPATVVKLGRVKVKVQDDFGNKPKWTYPRDLHPGWKEN
jgi:hypothetical protein